MMRILISLAHQIACRPESSNLPVFYIPYGRLIHFKIFLNPAFNID
jgi:hypothetical protein